MGTLYVDRRGSELDFERGALVLRVPDAPPRSVPLSLVDRLVVIGNVRLNSGLLVRLADQGAALAILPGRGRRRGAFLFADGHGDVVRRLGQYRLGVEAPLCAPWARRIVYLRLAGQRRLLRVAHRMRPDCRRPLLAAEQAVAAAAAKLREEAPDLESLRGREGAAAAAFFRGYVSLFPPSVGFSGRNRRPPKDPVNAALSLGYTLAHSDALRAVVGAGLDPGIGVYHQPAWSRESLACDLVELARGRVERFVWRLFADRVVTAGGFSDGEEGVRLNKGARAAYFAAWEAQAQLHRRWQARMAHALAKECRSLGETGAVEGGADEP